MEKAVEYLKASGENLSENKYFIGFTMILLNIGARFIIDELDDDLRKTVSDKFIRRLFIFCSFFMATKDIFIALILTIVFVIIINEFLATGKDESEKKEEIGGASYNKSELEKTIQKLKTIQTTM
jgi:putative Mn2+ efflux pump MntP